MKSYRAILFWFGGVLTESMAERTIVELAPGVKGNAVIPIRQQLRGLSGEFALGKISAQDYCRQAVAVCRSELAAAELARRITTSATLNDPVARLVTEIA